jgi:hypothetical protein
MSVALDVKVVVIGNPVYNGIPDPKADKKEFSVYPNPAGQYFYVSSSSVFRNVEVAIFDTRGSLVRSAAVKGMFPGREEINIQTISNGIYYVAITSEGKREIHKLIIAR